MGGWFASSPLPIVTGDAGTDDCGMIHASNRGPGSIGMTTVTTVGRRYVAAVFAGGGGAVMATGAVALNTVVAEPDR